MTAKRLISLRLDPELVARIDRHRWRSRTDWIAAACESFAEAERERLLGEPFAAHTVDEEDL